MPPRNVARFVVIFLAGMSALAGSTLAESAAVCSAYARGALNDFAESQKYRCGFSSGRWQDSYDSHFGWCLGAPAEWLRSESLHRQNELRACKGDPQAQRCMSYAQTAVQQQGRNEASGCGLTGVRWQDTPDWHLAWCLDNPEAAALEEQRSREALLGVCTNAPHHGECSRYAKTAVHHAEEAQRNQCGFGGPRWGTSYEAHLKWCVATRPTTPDALNIEANTREAELYACIQARNAGVPPPLTPVNDCAVYVSITTTRCYNLDGTLGTHLYPTVSHCGPDEETAFRRAADALAAVGAFLSDDPVAGHCTYTSRVH